MEESVVLIESLCEKVKDYSKTNYELFKLKAVDKSAHVVSSVVSSAITVFFAFMFILIASIAVSLWLGELLGKDYYGFFLVAGFYVLVWAILKLARNGLKKRVGDSYVKQILGT